MFDLILLPIPSHGEAPPDFVDAIVDHENGVSIELADAPLDLVAEFVDYLRDQKRKIDSAIGVLAQEACRRADRANTTTIEGRARLSAMVNDLARDGVLTVAAAQEILPHEPRLNTIALRRACKRPEIAAAVEFCVTERTTKPRRISRITKIGRV